MEKTIISKLPCGKCYFCRKCVLSTDERTIYNAETDTMEVVITIDCKNRDQCAEVSANEN